MRLYCWASLSGQLWLYPHLWSWYSFRPWEALSRALYLILVFCVRPSALCPCFYLCLVSGQHQPFLQKNNLTLIIGACHIHLCSCQCQVLGEAVSSLDGWAPHCLCKWITQQFRRIGLISWSLTPHIRENSIQPGNGVTLFIPMQNKESFPSFYSRWLK